MSAAGEVAGMTDNPLPDGLLRTPVQRSIGDRELDKRGAAISCGAIDVPVSFPQRRLLHLAHGIARQRIDEDDLFGRLELR